MLTRIESANYGTVVGVDQYVVVHVEGEPERLAMIMQTTTGRKYFCFDESFDIFGTEPPSRYFPDIRNALAMDSSYSVRSWQVHDTDAESVGELLDWLYSDCARVTESFVIAGAGARPTPSTPEFILKGYGTGNIYTGLHSYHHSHGETMNMPTEPLKEGAYRIGVELEVEAKSEGRRREINKIKSNWFMQETDSSLRDGRGIEFVTIPLLPKDAMNEKTWNPLVEFLNDKAVSYGSDRCGLHVHIGREALGKSEDDRQSTLGKLLYLYYEFLKTTDWNTRVFGRTRTYSEASFSCKESDAVKVLGVELMKDKKIRDKVDKGLKDVASRTRYYDINIQNSSTIEFRKGKGSICTERIVAIITYCDLMIRYCKRHGWSDLNADGFLAYIRKCAPKASPLFRYIPAGGEESCR